jgi:hypothetical protein
VDDFLSAALALLLRTLPDLSRKIQTAVAVHQTRFVTGKLADYATAQRADHYQSGDKRARGAPCRALFSVADSGAADWAGWLVQQSASPVVVVAA